MIYQRNQAVGLFLMKKRLLWFRTKWNTFLKVKMIQEKCAKNFPGSRNVKIGAPLKHSVIREKQKGNTKL